MSEPRVWSQLHLPRPLDPELAAQFLARLAADKDARRLVLEVRSDHGELSWLLGCAATDVQGLRRLLGDLLPGSLLTGLDALQPRRPVTSAGRLLMRPQSLPMRMDTAVATTRAILSALAAAAWDGEALVLQVVLGPRRPPMRVLRNAADPSKSWWQSLRSDPEPIDSELRTRLRERQSQHGFQATVRVGVTGPDAGRRRRQVAGLLGALSTAIGPGQQIALKHEHADRLNEGSSPRWWPLRLSASEVLPLLGWPLGDEDFPGVPPLHPRLLAPASDVHRGSRTFAVSAAPGTGKEIGISAQDALFHTAFYGPTGSGKTTALLRLITADIAAGLPVVVLDPKQQLIDDVLRRIPANRIDDVVLLDATETSPVGFNPLQTTGRDPDVVVDGILAVFQAVFAEGWGPRTADIFSACLRTLARTSRPDEPATLTDLPRLLTDPAFRRTRVGAVQQDLGLAGFWAWYENLQPQGQAAAVAAPLNKLRALLLRPALMRMLEQRQPAFHVRDTFRQNRILLVPLNEGLIGEGTASLLGSLLVADVWAATQERATEPGAHRRPGMVYIDEAPRFMHLPLSLADALAQSRSLSVGWHLAAQYRSQFPGPMRTAVDMNARSKVAFATEYEDARDLARMAPALAAEDFIALDRFAVYANLVAGGRPSGWASLRTLPPPPETSDPATIRAASQARYAAPKPAVVIEAATPAERPTSGQPPADGTPDTAAPTTSASPERIGRKRRQP